MQMLRIREKKWGILLIENIMGDACYFFPLEIFYFSDNYFNILKIYICHSVFFDVSQKSKMGICSLLKNTWKTGQCRVQTQMFFYLQYRTNRKRCKEQGEDGIAHSCHFQLLPIAGKDRKPCERLGDGDSSGTWLGSQLIPSQEYRNSDRREGGRSNFTNHLSLQIFLCSTTTELLHPTSGGKRIQTEDKKAWM